MLRAGYDKRKAYKLLIEAIKSNKMFSVVKPDDLEKYCTISGLFIYRETKQGLEFWWKINRGVVIS